MHWYPGFHLQSPKKWNDPSITHERFLLQLNQFHIESLVERFWMKNLVHEFRSPLHLILSTKDSPWQFHSIKLVMERRPKSWINCTPTLLWRVYHVPKEWERGFLTYNVLLGSALVYIATWVSSLHPNAAWLQWILKLYSSYTKKKVWNLSRND